MSESRGVPPTQSPASAPIAPPERKRARPGERRVLILQMLATMLEQPGGERITTAGLAARLGVSEAALYRHFASKAQMFEALIDFIEHTVLSLINQIVEREAATPGPDIAVRQTQQILRMLAQFAEKNPGMARVMVGDALVFEHERLQQRMNALFDKIEATLKQCLREAHHEGTSQGAVLEPQVQAAVALSFMVGRLQRYVRSGFRRLPSEHLDQCLGVFLG